MFLMRFPEGYIWGYPGFPSLVIPYDKTNDFFFSGHVGGALIASLEYRANGHFYIFLFGLFTMACQFFMMVCMRGHYSIDLFSGLIFGLFFFLIAVKIAPYVD